MAFKVNTNVSALNTQRWLGISGSGQSKALERLSSGYKINKAADDAAGIAIATKLNVKAVSMVKSIDNGNQALAMLQTAEGGLDQISNILTRLKEIATQSASDNTTDRTALDQERSNLETEITKIAQNTQYGSIQLLQGSKTSTLVGTSLTAANGIEDVDVSTASISGGTTFTLTMTAAAGGIATLTLVSMTSATTQNTENIVLSGLTGLTAKTASFTTSGVKVTVNAAAGLIGGSNGLFTVAASTSSFDFQVGDANQGYNQIQASLANFDATGTKLLLSGDISTMASARTYMTTLDTAIGNLTTDRGKLGAAMNQISYHVANLETMTENTRASVSTIKDADFAAEMADFTKFQILQQSGIAMLSQANQMGQMVLSLLK